VFERRVVDTAPNTLFYPTCCLYWCMYSTLYRNCTHRRLPEDEPSVRNM